MANVKEAADKRDLAADDLADMTTEQIISLVAARKNVKASDAESAKVHPLTKFSLGPKEWDALKKHILDGGGVTDDRDLATTVFQALLHDDQPTFWAGLIHILKSRAKINGVMRPLPFGGVSLSGIAPGGRGVALSPGPF